MGKRSRNMLADFAVGALSSVQKSWETKRAEQAQALRDARLAEIAEASQVRNFEQQKSMFSEERTARKEERAIDTAARADETAADRDFRTKMQREEMAGRASLQAQSEAGSNRRASMAQQGPKERGELYATNKGSTVLITNDAAGEAKIAALQAAGDGLSRKLSSREPELMSGPGGNMFVPGQDQTGNGRAAPGGPNSPMNPKTSFQWNAQGKLVPGGG